MKNIIQVFEALEHKGNKKFLLTGDKQLSYAQLLENTIKISGLFAQKGIKKGDRVILSVANDQDMILFFIAALRNGITTVLIDPAVKKDRANAIARAVDPAGWIIDEALAGNWQIDENTPTLLVRQGQQKKGKLFTKLLGKKAAAEAPSPYYPESADAIDPATVVLPHEIDPETIAYIIYTSGTTADSKGVAITHKNLFAHLATLSNVYDITEDAELLNILNLYHADGIIQGPVLALYNQATIHRPLQFSINETGNLFLSIYRLRITHLFLVPAIISLMDKFAEGYEDSFHTEDFKCVISVSSHIEEALWERFINKFKTTIVNVYGLTETVAGSLFCGPAADHFKMGTIGKPVDCEARIIDESGRELPAEEEGELQLQGPHIMGAYFNNPEATKEAIQNGWLSTGDIAVKSKDGFYRITGRKKNIIISGGFNIHPEEVTEVLNNHPDVAEAVSFGIPDEVFGEKLVSCVVFAENNQGTEQQLTAYCRTHLEPEKVPAKIQAVSSLPKGLSGKVKLEEAKQLFHAAQKVSTNAGNDSHLTVILQLAAAVFRVPLTELNRNSTSYTVSGWDSLSHLALITDLEEHFNTRFSTAEVMIMNSISSIANIVNGKIK